MSRLIARILAALAIGVFWVAAPVANAAAPITIFAAASLKNALDDAIAQWKAADPAPVVAAYAASSTLARQIAQGAPADIFISADAQWMDYLAKRSLVETPHDLLGNRLVLISSASSTTDVDLRPGVDLARLLGGGRLAMGDPTNVPAGIYAREALQQLGQWDAVQSRLAPAVDVRAALALVSRGEAPFGVVYETDARSDPAVRIAGIFPDGTHAPIRYPIAIVRTSQNPAAARFIAFLDSAPAQAIFARLGFRIIAH